MLATDGRKWLTPAVHLLVIGILFILPEALMRMAFPGRGSSMPWMMYAKSGIMIAVFYINYFVVIPRMLLRGHRWWQFVAINLVIIAAFSVLAYYLSRIGWSPRHKYRDADTWQQIVAATSFLLRDAVTLILTVSLAVVIKLSGRWVDLERRQQKLLAARRESELENLRAQLNPHFLFNTLNSIYALILIDPDKARNAVHQLSALLRYIVYENPDRVPLSREVDFVRSYVELMQMRMPARPVSLTVEGVDSSLSVTPLVFVTLVENAFKHGNTPDASLPIDISVVAGSDGVVCRTVNHFDPAARTDRGHSGVGLANLRRRLELIYGRDASLSIRFDGDVCNVELKIPEKCR